MRENGTGRHATLAMVRTMRMSRYDELFIAIRFEVIA